VTQQSPGPLAGLTVVDLGQLIAGPMVATILGDFGARVIKVEQPGRPDPLRVMYQREGIGVWSKSSDRNKLPITLNVKTREGLAILKQLVSGADVLVENFLPGTLERLGLGQTELDELNSSLVVARVSGWGQTGPKSTQRGYGRLGEAASGFANLNGTPDGPPSHSAASLGDTAAAIWTAFGVMVALRHRDATGQGQVVDMGMPEGLMRMLEQQIPVLDQLGWCLSRMGNENPANVTVNVYKTADDRYFSVSAATPRTQRALLDLVGLPADHPLGTVERAAQDRPAFHAHMAAWMSERTLAEVQELFHAAGTTGTPVLSADSIIDDPHFLAREMVVTVPDDDLGSVRMAGVVPRLTRTPGRIISSGRGSGSANIEVLGPDGLGLSLDELDQLRSKGVL